MAYEDQENPGDAIGQVFTVAIVRLALLYVPAPIAEQFGLQAFRENYRPWIGAAAFISVAWLLSTPDLPQWRMDRAEGVGLADPSRRPQSHQRRRVSAPDDSRVNLEASGLGCS